MRKWIFFPTIIKKQLCQIQVKGEALEFCKSFHITFLKKQARPVVISQIIVRVEQSLMGKEGKENAKIQRKNMGTRPRSEFTDGIKNLKSV